MAAAGKAVEQILKVAFNNGEPNTLMRTGSDEQAHVVWRSQPPAVEPHCLAQYPLDTVALRCRSHRLPHGNHEAGFGPCGGQGLCLKYSEPMITSLPENFANVLF